MLTAIAIFAIISFSFSQDKIYRNNGKVIEAKVLEISSSEIKYREYDNMDGPIYVLEADRIKKIVFENGKEQKFTEDIRDPERYSGQLTKAIKVNFLSALYGYTEIGFEKNTGVGKSYELSVGIIGAGKAGIINWYYPNQVSEAKRDPFGIFVSGGYKFGKLPDFIFFGKTRMTHLMQGTYAKPIVYIGHYKENQVQEKGNNQFVVGKQNVTFGALQIELGKQWVFGDRFLLDIYWGVVYGFDNKEESVKIISSNYYYYNDYSAFNYANGRAGKSPGLSGTFGIKMGLLMK